MSYGLTVNNDANCYTTTYFPIICAVFVQVILFNYKTIFSCHFLIVEGIVLKLLSVKNILCTMQAWNLMRRKGINFGKPSKLLINLFLTKNMCVCVRAHTHAYVGVWVYESDDLQTITPGKFCYGWYVFTVKYYKLATENFKK